MSTDPREDLSGDAPTINGIVSPQETAKIAQNLVRGLRTFTSDQGFRDLAELVDRIPKLEKEILEKDIKLKRASEDLKNGERTHATELKRNLWLYGDDANRFRKEIANLEQQAKELQTTLVQKEIVISDLGKKEESLKNAGRKLEDAYKEKASKLKEKEVELVKLKKKAEDSQTEIKNLSVSLKGSQNQVTVLKQTLDQCEKRNTQLNEKLETTCRGLEDLRGMSATLENTDPKAV
jgi:chromosome segregation ATPase